MKAFVLYFMLSGFVCLLSLNSLLGQSVKLTPDSFSPAYYLMRYPDVAKKYTKENAIEHYRDFGVKEGRSPNPFFEPEFYSDQNEDVKLECRKKAEPALFWVAILAHWHKHGIKEGRRGSSLFNVRAYRAMYKDLRDALDKTPGIVYLSYYYHFRDHGCNENRERGYEDYAKTECPEIMRIAISSEAINIYYETSPDRPPCGFYQSVGCETNSKGKSQCMICNYYCGRILNCVSDTFSESLNNRNDFHPLQSWKPEK